MTGKEPSMGLNNFQKAKYKNETETVAASILNLLFGRPGYFPSMPTLGINIQSYMYSFWDEINPEAIKSKIARQCDAFSEYIQTSELDVLKMEYKGKPVLLIVIPVQIKTVNKTLGIGLGKDDKGNITYNYAMIEDTE
jgi:hypothetical protein